MIDIQTCQLDRQIRRAGGIVYVENHTIYQLNSSRACLTIYFMYLQVMLTEFDEDSF